MNRRTFLRRAGAAGALATLAGCSGDGGDWNSGTPTETESGETAGTDVGGATGSETRQTTRFDAVPAEYRERFDRLVDVTEAGADASGSEPINPVLDDSVADDTLLYFPSGRYFLEGSWFHQEFRNVAFYGPDATLVPPTEYAGNMFVLGDGSSARGLVFDGFTVDVTPTATGPRVVHATVADGLLVRDLSVSGVQDTDQGLSRFDVTDPDGSGRVERMRMPDGGQPGTVATGCLVGPRSEGHVTFADCEIARFPDNGLYASPAPGTVDVVGGTYANNGIANVRVSDGSVVRGVRVVCDEARDGVQNMRGIRLRAGDGALVENCEVVLSSVTSSDGGIVLSSGMGSATVRDSRIRVDADDVAAIRAKPPSDASASNVSLQCENVVIEGTAANGRSIHVADRDDSTFDALCLHQTGANRDGFFFFQSQNAQVTDSRVSVTGDPVVSRNSSVRTDGLDTGGTGCGPDRSESYSRL